MTSQEYINTYAQDMIDACAGTGLFPSVMMAQGIIESRNGDSLLASKYNNHFGIKCQCTACACNLLNQYVIMKTKEEVNGQMVTVDGKFRSYKNTYDGFADRIDFLKSNPRYAKAGVFTAQTPQEQVDALYRAGYATDSGYAGKINNIINKFGLENLDAVSGSRRLTSNQTNYAIVGGIIIALTGYVYYLKRKKII